MASPASDAYVRSRVAQSYEELLGQLEKKKTAGAALQLLALTASQLDDEAVAPLVRLACEGPRAQAAAAHHLLRLAAPRVASR